MSNTKIEWGDKTWNPITGCTKISPGCTHCYAESMAKRLRGRVGYDADDPFGVTFHPERLDEPDHWRKPSRIFVCSMGDLFHHDVRDWWREKILQVMIRNPRHTFIILTKRSEQMQDWSVRRFLRMPPPNLWFGVSVETEEYMYRVRHLRQTRAAVLFVSFEPLLGPIESLRLIEGLNWVIVGGESGPGSRPMQSEWVVDIQHCCFINKIPFFFKQWGGVHKKQNGRELMGREWNAFPEVRHESVF